MTVCEEKTWLEAEMDASMKLLRAKVEIMNNLSVSQVGPTVLENFKNLYRSVYYISYLRKNMGVAKAMVAKPCPSWLHTEMLETITLMRKKLHEMNQTEVECVNTQFLADIKNAYKTLYYIIMSAKDVPETSIPSL